MKTRKQLLQELNSQMPENFSALEKAAYIANFVANQNSFDEHFWWGNAKERSKIYTLAKQEALTANEETTVHRKIICVTETSLFAYLAQKSGLEIGYMVEGEENFVFKNSTVFKYLENPQHISPVVKDEQGRWIKVDVQKDLENWKTGCKPEFFGSKDHEDIAISELSSEEQDEILKKIGYAKEGQEPYTDAIVERYINENINKTIDEQFEAIFEDKRILEYYKNLRTIDAYNFTKKLCRKISEQNSGKHLSKMVIFVCFVKTSEEDREYNFGIFFESKKSEWIHMFSKRQKKMIRISKQEMKYMLDRDLMLRGKRFNEGRIEKFVKKANYEDIEEEKAKNLKEELMYEDEEK